VGNFIFNKAKGKLVEYAQRVEDNDPTNAAFIILAINTAATDATLKDLDTVAAIEADANTAEVTNSGYARKTLANGALTITTDDSGDLQSVDCADQVWAAVTAGDAWTDLVLAYDSDTTSGADSAVIPIACYDFAVTPNGGSITAQINASGLFSST
jgi:hypothetical protein